MIREHLSEPTSPFWRLRALLERVAEANQHALALLRDATEHCLSVLRGVLRGVAAFLADHLPF
jgi:hypothetical protein